MVKRHIGKLKHAPPEHQPLGKQAFVAIDFARRVIVVGHALACLRLMRKHE